MLVVRTCYAFILIFLQALFITRFINSEHMLSKSTYFPGMAYLLITSLIPEWNYFSAALLTNTILIFLLSSLFSIYNQQNARGKIFNIGLALGIASFIFIPSVSYIIWVLIALSIMRPFRIDEWAVCIAGLITPFYFYGVYLFLIDEFKWNALWMGFVISTPNLKQSFWLAGTAFLLALPFLAGAYYVQYNLRKMLIQIRKGWSLLLLFLVGSLFVPFINHSDSLENWVIITIPFAAFHANAYFSPSLRIFPLLLFWLTISFILGYQYYGPGW